MTDADVKGSASGVPGTDSGRELPGGVARLGRPTERERLKLTPATNELAVHIALDSSSLRAVTRRELSGVYLRILHLRAP